MSESHVNSSWNGRWDRQLRSDATEGTRFAGASLLMGTLWLLARQRDKLQCSTNAETDCLEEVAARPQWDFSRSARRQRKLDDQ